MMNKEPTRVFITVMVQQWMFQTIGMLRLFYQRETGLTILLMVCLCSITLAQGRADRPSFFVRGHCVDIFQDIKDSTKSDSIAIQKFIQYYTFENEVSFTTLQWKEAITYVSKKENSQLFCRLKHLPNDINLEDSDKGANKKKLEDRTNGLRK